ncbi:hypothetical protein HMPREF1983_01348 [Gemella bergeri ATCC 700627]|uniref:DNA-directed RNA polymerase subunit beta n=1 Tax=Gemella bergeri ATCC 700627 TaxID=1321820 RepID=U2Q171_9BACL|nr:MULTISPECIES: DNA-directed RNA polymerase subunit beta [Gemella]AXI26226.1 DNA-directed RNA polymerase subunit beta [Gemella sp. ND 6198]ERK56475.1 hypothetical protein HMPREF1983_01348 [Gemella bergeri ATCC 700627]
MKIDNTILRYLRNIALILLVFYIGTIIGYVVFGKGSLMDAVSLKSIKHIKDIIYN